MKLDMKYKSLINLLYFLGFTLKTKHRNLTSFTSFSFFFSYLLAFENLQQQLVFKQYLLVSYSVNESLYPLLKNSRPKRACQ
jgi:hypothetical protein